MKTFVENILKKLQFSSVHTLRGKKSFFVKLFIKSDIKEQPNHSGHRFIVKLDWGDEKLNTVRLWLALKIGFGLEA